MEVRRAASVPEFMALAGDFLEDREAEHNLIFGICSTLEADPAAFDGPPYLAAVLHGDRVVGAALRTPPWRLVLSEVDHPAAVHQLAEDLSGTELPGCVGPSTSARHFAEAWTERTGVAAGISTHERAFRLERVIPARPAPGFPRLCTPQDRDVLIEWLRAFHDEALHSAPLQDFGAMADRGIRGVGRRFHFWMDEGRAVSLTGVGGLTPNGIRIGPVYTPPEHRGRGYASNLVAQVSQAQIDAGRRFVFLFTDLANPTSNKIYQDIGYEPVIDIDEYVFGAD